MNFKLGEYKVVPLKRRAKLVTKKTMAYYGLWYVDIINYIIIWNYS